MLSPRLDSLGVRPLETEDAEELHALIEANRSHLARWLPWAAGQNREGTERFLAEAEAQLARDDGFQARIAPEGEIVGVVGFHSIDWIDRNTSLGYWLAADAQSRGTMTTVVSALLDHAFYEWELHRVEIHCAPENSRSRAIPERLGFRQEARLRETELIDGRYLDSVVYGLLEAEWGSRFE
ncbi:MAG: ribosomal-protein-serine acetyltransferase [Solirubrobacterales bacterium]|jgi:ribosomal-protein-serine acetyltransferase|nr:ribosomal-protein-serine acetyltransferase [Solirubrobacterales bacterium]